MVCIPDGVPWLALYQIEGSRPPPLLFTLRPLATSELVILLSQPPGCWKQSYTAPLLVKIYFLVESVANACLEGS